MSAPVVPDSHAHLLEGAHVAQLATVRPDGSPQCNPVWFSWDGAHLFLSQVATTRKLRNMRREPRVSLVVVDPNNPFHYLEVRGEVDTIEPDQGLVFLASLTERYLPPDRRAQLPVEDRVVVRIRPTALAKELGYGAG
jgi:PPOX class probable F420-dependent enzyme